jgi:extracellular matrix regulatory protein A
LAEHEIRVSNVDSHLPPPDNHPKIKLYYFIMQDFKFVNVGFSSMVPLHQIQTVSDPEGASVKRLITEARSHKCLLDATHGRRTRSIMMMHSGHIILSSIQLDTLAQRIANAE